MPKFRTEPRMAARRLLFGDPRQRGAEYVWLGNLSEIGPRVPAFLDTSVEHVLAIVGKRGSGKSFTLGVLLEALSTRETETTLSKLVPSHAVLLLDSLNIYWPSGRPVPLAGFTSPVLEEQARLLNAWRLSPVQVNVDLWAPAGHVPSYLHGEAAEFRFTVAELTAQDLADLFDVDLLRDPIGQALDEAWRKVTLEGWELADGTRRTRSSEPTLSDAVDCIDEDRDLARNYASETLRALRQRFRAMAGHPIFGREGTSLGELLRAGRAAILLLAEVPDDLRRVFVSVLARKLLAERAVASGIAKRQHLGLGSGDGRSVGSGVPPTWFMIDEAQNFLPARSATAATEALVRFVREGRNLGLSFVVTTQQPTAVDSRIMAQVDVLIAHQLSTGRDIQVVQDNLKSPLPRSIKLGSQSLKLAGTLPLLDPGQAFVTASELGRAVFIDVRPRITMHGGFEA